MTGVSSFHGKETNIMGGLPCAKSIIDNGNALTQAMQCMNASILLNAPHTQPTEAMEDEFLMATAQVSKVAKRIEKYVRTGTE